MDAPMNPNIPRQNASGTGFVIATVILLLVIVAGAVYFWKARTDKALTNDAALSGIEQQSNDDSAASIEADLNATDVNNVDYDLTESNFTAS